MRFVVDVNLTQLWIAFLIGHGYDSVHWNSIGRHDDDDATILEWARAGSCIIMTCDLDFGRILAETGTSGPSVVQLRTAISLPAYVGDAVVRAIESTEADLVAGALLTIGATRTRLRRLPFEKVV